MLLLGYQILVIVANLVHMAAVDITSLCNLPVFWCFSFFFYFWGISKFVREGFGKEGRKGRKRKETEKFGKEGKAGKENLDLCCKCSTRVVFIFN